jgi:uncharacterized membrane protein YdjX (TVP38/TMEM64 family)
MGVSVIESTDRRHDPDSGAPIRYFLVIGALLILFLALFVVVALISIAVLDDPSPFLRADSLGAVVGVTLLIADVLLPVPSSLIMIALGALFGTVGGTFLSLIGSVGSALLGYALGRWAGPTVLARVCSQQEREKADRFVARWGVVAVAASRPIPLVAETVAIAAGASGLGVGKTALAATVGALPGSVIFAFAGAAGLDAPNGFVVFGAVVAASIVLWLIGRRIHPGGG